MAAPPVPDPPVPAPPVPGEPPVPEAASVPPSSRSTAGGGVFPVPLLPPHPRVDVLAAHNNNGSSARRNEVFMSAPRMRSGATRPEPAGIIDEAPAAVNVREPPTSSPTGGIL